MLPSSTLGHTMVTVSEQGGTLSESLAVAADFFEEQLDQRVALLSKLVEPFIFVVVGAFVGIVYFGFFMAVLTATRSAM